MTAQDLTGIDDVLDALYAALARPAGERDWNAMRQIFHDDAKFTRGDAALSSASLDQCRERPALAPPQSHEVERRIERFGNIAYAWSTYEEKEAPEAKGRRGVNSIQLFLCDDGRWRIVSLAWDHARA